MASWHRTIAALALGGAQAADPTSGRRRLRPFRILLTLDAVGGVWQYANELRAALRPLGVETTLALLGPGPDASQRAELDASAELIETGFDLDWLAPDLATVMAAGKAIGALARDLAVDLVHLNQPALAASAAFPVPVVSAIHSCVATWWEAVEDGPLPPAFAWQTDLVRQGLARSDAVLAPSKAFAETVQRTYDLQCRPHVVPNGRSLQVAQGAEPDAFAFTAGRLWDKGKNVLLLDRVAARLDVPFKAAGATQAPTGEPIVLQHIETLGRLGAQAMAAHLSRRPIFVSAARYEPFGLAMLEAAAAGCALVLSDIPTLRENWDGVAWFVDDQDEDGFVEAVTALLHNSALRELHGMRARFRARRFTVAAMAAGTHAIYAQALAGRAASLRGAVA